MTRGVVTGLLVALIVGISPMRAAYAERIKDLASIQGVRSNQLIGYGLVVGLDGSGDQTTQTPFTVQSLTAMLSQLGVTLPPGVNLQLKNVAAVMLTAGLTQNVTWNNNILPPGLTWTGAGSGNTSVDPLRARYRGLSPNGSRARRSLGGCSRPRSRN